MKHLAYSHNVAVTAFIKKIIIDNMRIALENDYFEIYLQPKYDLRDNTIVGAEALSRWVDPKIGIVFTYEYIPIFERTGFISKFDKLMWEQVCQLISKWIKGGRNGESRKIHNGDAYRLRVSEL